MSPKGRLQQGGAEHGFARWIGTGGEIPSLIEYMKKCRDGKVGLSGGVKPMKMYDDEIAELISLVEENISQLSRTNEKQAVKTYIGRPENLRVSGISVEEEKRQRLEYRGVMKKLAGKEKTMIQMLEKQIRSKYIAKSRAEKYRSTEDFSGDVASSDDFRDLEWLGKHISKLEEWYSDITSEIQESQDISWINNTQRPKAKGKTLKKRK